MQRGTDVSQREFQYAKRIQLKKYLKILERYLAH